MDEETAYPTLGWWWPGVRVVKDSGECYLKSEETDNIVGHHSEWFYL